MDNELKLWNVKTNTGHKNEKNICRTLSKL